MYRFSRILFSFFAFSACLAFPASLSLGASSVNVPLDSWVYEALEELEGYGLIESALSGTRPCSRLEIARLLVEAIQKWEARQSYKKPAGFAEEELIPSIFDKFKKEFKPELVEWGIIEASKAPTFFKPVGEIISRYVYQSDSPVIRPQSGTPPTHIVYPIYNNDGIVYQKNHNFSFEVEGEARLWNHISFYYRPIMKAFENEGAYAGLEKGYVKLEGINIELEAGRDSLWWGPGRHGALLMTNNARPFDMIKLSNPLPYRIPLLGLFKFNIFLSKLDYDLPVAHPIIYGLRLNLKPHPILELGISQIAIFDGEGRSNLGFEDILRILYSNQNLTGNLESNQQLSIDVSLRWPNFDRILPIARSLKFYGEIGAEDTGFLPDRRAYLLGFFLTDFLLVGRMDLRLEYSNNSAESVPTAWYTHAFYPPVYHERIFGHYVGSNGQDIFARLSGYLSPRVLLGVDFDMETHGARGAITTRSYQPGIDIDYRLRDQMNIKGRYILESFRDPESIAGGDQTQHIFALEFRWRF